MRSDIFAEYVKVENGIAIINLPEKIMPIITDDSHINLLYTTFNPELIYNGGVDWTLKGWKYLESNQIDLGKASQLLAWNEIYTSIRYGFYPATSSMISLAEIAFLVYFLKQNEVENVEHQIPKIRRKIGNLNKGTIKHADNNLKSGKHPPIAVMELEDSLASLGSELWICRELVEQNFDVIFNHQSQGPDLYLNKKSVKLEVTKKSEQLNLQDYEMWMTVTQEDPNRPTTQISQLSILVTLSLILADKLEEKLNQGDIVVIDVSNILEGTELLALKYFSDAPDEFELRYAMNQALNLMNEGKQSLVFYSRANNTSTAVCVDAETIMDYINHIKEHERPLISLRKKNPYTTIEMFSNMLNH